MGIPNRYGQVIKLIEKGKSNKEIAGELGITVGTVKEYLFKIFKRVKVSNRTELALKSIKGEVERDYI